MSMIPRQQYRETGAKYLSASKGPQVIADMNDFHLVAAFNKLKATVLAQSVAEDTSLIDQLCNLARELAYRDLTPEHKGGLAPGDWRLPPAEDTPKTQGPQDEGFA